MFGSYLKVALRNIVRQKGYSLINVAGLAVGMACFILIVLWVRHEMSYDKFHLNADRLYLVTDYEKYSDGGELEFSVNPPELAPTLIREYPEIVDAVRYKNIPGRVIRHQDRFFSEDRLAVADPSFLALFSFEFIKGEPAQALVPPNSMVITQSMAGKYFGDADPMGKTLQVDGRADFAVTGIIQDVPSNSHLEFDFLVPFSAVRVFDLPTDGWNTYAYKIYVMIADDANPGQLSEKIAGAVRQHHDQEAIVELSLQPVTDIHLSRGKSGIYIFSLIAAFILLTACINYMNLATARAGKRTKEVGLRKVIGASRREIVLQFFGESILVSLVALCLSLLLVEIFLPMFNDLSAKQLSFGLMKNGSVILILLSTAVATGTISGSYPALFLSSLAPASVLKGSWRSGPRGMVLRRVLVSLQFVLSIALIIGTVVMGRQLHFIQDWKLGFDKEQVLCIGLKGESSQKYKLLKDELSKSEGVVGISAASDPPAGLDMSTLIHEWGDGETQGDLLMHRLFADWDFVATLGVEMAEGRFLSERFVSDTSASVVVNQAAVRAMGMESPLGKEVLGSAIVGVVKDFHFNSLHSEIKPLAIQHRSDLFRFLLVKIRPGDVSRFVGSLSVAWGRLVPGTPFEYQFLDENIDRMYRTDQRMGRMIDSFTILALFVACLGLFGMASFTAEQRTKEIGIRKVLGATIPGISFSLIKEFGKWVLLANLIAWPLAYLTMNRVLEVYAYRISLDIWIFLAAGASAMIVAIMTVGCQSVRAALANPVDSLRYE